MKLLSFITVTAAFWLFACTASYADPQFCTSIANDTERLRCFDGYFETPDIDVQNTKLPTPTLDLAELAQMPPLDARIAQEMALVDQPFAITPHLPTYILPATYNANASFDEFGEFGELFNDSEIKMQLSLKTMLIQNLWKDASVWAAYTQQSYWQLYADSDASAPFRETNHKPEVFMQIPQNFEILGWRARLATLGLVHQSNGRALPLSRSWNRVTAELELDRKNFVFAAKTWARIDNPDVDNNPNIEDYMGRLQLRLAYKRQGQTFEATLKNNLSSDNRSGLELNWTFPLFQHLKGFVQIYSGYGENLIDMENYNNRIGVGIALTDWL